ncbi:MAG: hypothetical protein JWQ21_836 [Herminiimonas sp.]|nr:hypothetical protein [Herminiimonas sp.]
MDLIAKKALEKLLRSAEGAIGKQNANEDLSGSARAIQIRFSPASFPDYLNITTHAEKTSCNASLRLAERDGAISIHWDSRAGSFERIQLIRLVNGDSLAKVLGVTPRWDAIGTAAAAFVPHLQNHPVLSDVLDAWSGGSSIRSTRPDKKAIQDWLDAIKVVDICRDPSKDKRTDMPIRRLSTALFYDSKRIAAIAPLIDVLTQGKTNGLPRDPEEFFQEMGLVKYPPTLLMVASRGNWSRMVVKLEDDFVSISAPYLGFHPPSIVGLNFPQEPITLLTVENLTTFHEIAELLRIPSDDGPVLVIYTGGMPSPAWRRVYRMALSSLTEGSSVLHWGDIDAGGFRIANKLAEDCDQCERRLLLHLMDVLPAASRKSLSDAEVASITAICIRHNWDAEAKSVEFHRSAIEQESLPVELPTIQRRAR